MSIRLTDVPNGYIARAHLAAQDTFTASITVAQMHPGLAATLRIASREAYEMRRIAHEGTLYGGDLVDLDTLRECDPTCDSLMLAHEAAADDAEIRDAIADEHHEAYAQDLALSTRDDGAIYHGRLPGDDCDGFSPHIVAQRGSVRAQHEQYGPRVLFRLPTIPGEWEVA
jgi:hypothetical protein